MMRVRCVVFLLLLSGCGFGNTSLDGFVPKETDRYARDYLALIARGDVDSALHRLPLEIQTDSARYFLQFMADSLAGVRLDSAAIIGATWNTTMMAGSSRTVFRTSYLVPMRTHWMLATLAMVDSVGAHHLTGFRYDLLVDDPRVTSAFTFRGKGPVHYLWLLLGIVCAATALAAAVWVGRQKGFPRRWFWVFVALVGAGTSSLDWSSGETGYRIFNALLFCFGATKGGPASPWVFSFAFPAGALIAVAKVKKWRADLLKPAPAVAPPAGVQLRRD